MTDHEQRQRLYELAHALVTGLPFPDSYRDCETDDCDEQCHCGRESCTHDMPCWCNFYGDDEFRVWIPCHYCFEIPSAVAIAGFLRFNETWPVQFKSLGLSMDLERAYQQLEGVVALETAQPGPPTSIRDEVRRRTKRTPPSRYVALPSMQRASLPTGQSTHALLEDSGRLLVPGRGPLALPDPGKRQR